MYADGLLGPLYDRLLDDLGDLAPFDAHTHIGANDPDGFRCSFEELTSALALARSRAVVFPMHEPGGYAEANDAVLAHAEASGGTLVAFCRVDPREGGAAEARRCLAAGARGVKLHPRAEQFALHEPGVEEVLAVAAEGPVPVLVHAGRGIPSLGRDAVELSGRFPRLPLILAHAGVSDLGWIWSEAREHPNLLFDTSWWAAADILALFALVPPGQIVYGSDVPYGAPVQSLVLTLRCALQAGLEPDAVRAVAGGQLERLLAGDPPLDLGPAPGARGLSADPLLARVHFFCGTALGAQIAGAPVVQQIELARSACDVAGDDHRRAAAAWALRLLDAVPESSPGGLTAEGIPGAHLVMSAAAVALTPDVPLP